MNPIDELREGSIIMPSRRYKPLPWTPGIKKWAPLAIPAHLNPAHNFKRGAVYRIPSEILNEIFLHAVIRRGGKRPVKSYRSVPLGNRADAGEERVGVSKDLIKVDEFDCVTDVFLLRSICRVCRIWRTTAINSHALWRYVRNDLPIHYVMKMFDRAGEQPLYADIEFDKLLPSVDAECIQEILRRLPRTKTLKIDAPDSKLFSRYFEWLEESAPVLENLLLTSRPSTFVLPGQVPDITILPNDIFNASTPALRILMLEQVVLPYDSPVYTSNRLTNLHLRFIPPAHHMPLSELIGILTKAPQLEVLELISAGPQDTQLPSNFSEDHYVSLPHLRTFSFQGMTSDVVGTLMNALQTPSLVFLDNRHEGPCLPSVRCILPHKFGLPLISKHALELNVAIVPGMFTFSVFSANSSSRTAAPKLIGKLTYKHGQVNAMDADVHALLSVLDKTCFAANVVSLHIDINPHNMQDFCHITPYILHQLLWRMPQCSLLRFVPAGVKKLEADYCMTALGALRGYFNNEGDAGLRVGTRPHVPMLRTVVFQDMTWDSTSVRKLIDWLQIRMSQRVKMQKLCFVGKHVRALRNLHQTFSTLVSRCEFYPT